VDLAKWKSQMRLTALVRRWKRERVAGDELAFDALDRWRYHDWHLWGWEAEQRERALRARDDLYHRVAAILSTSFKTLVFEDFDIRELAKKGAVDGKYQNEYAASNRHLASPGSFRLILRRAFEARRGEVVVVPAADNTRTCHHCGVVEAFDAAASVERKPACSGCGAEWDQDDNNVRVQLRYYELKKEAEKRAAASAAATPAAPSVPQATRWQRVKDRREEKQARVAVAQRELTRKQEDSGSAPP
jgi:transposase